MARIAFSACAYSPKQTAQAMRKMLDDRMWQLLLLNILHHTACSLTEILSIEKRKRIRANSPSFSFCARACEYRTEKKFYRTKIESIFRTMKWCRRIHAVRKCVREYSAGVEYSLGFFVFTCLPSANNVKQKLKKKKEEKNRGREKRAHTRALNGEKNNVCRQRTLFAREKKEEMYLCSEIFGLESLISWMCSREILTALAKQSKTRVDVMDRTDREPGWARRKRADDDEEEQQRTVIDIRRAETSSFYWSRQNLLCSIEFLHEQLLSSNVW